VFTGIVTAVGAVRAVRRTRGPLELEVDSRPIARELARGDSVAVDGVCLTATSVRRRRFTTQVMEETLARTTLGELERGARVNLELPARPSDRLGGHIVQGHVDAVVEAVRVDDAEGTRRLWWRAGDEALRYIVPKGSVALNGVSLTVVDVGRTTFEVDIIPHTLSATTLVDVTPGSRANLELDVIAKYVERVAAGWERRTR
jgi:riboflavin synthase